MSLNRCWVTKSSVWAQMLNGFKLDNDLKKIKELTKWLARVIITNSYAQNSLPEACLIHSWSAGYECLSLFSLREGYYANFKTQGSLPKIYFSWDLILKYRSLTYRSHWSLDIFYLWEMRGSSSLKLKNPFIQISRLSSIVIACRPNPVFIPYFSQLNNYVKRTWVFLSSVESQAVLDLLLPGLSYQLKNSLRTLLWKHIRSTKISVHEFDHPIIWWFSFSRENSRFRSLSKGLTANVEAWISS